MPDIVRKLNKAAVLLGRRGNRMALLKYGVAASTEHDALLGSKTFDMVVDVGANKGQFSLATRHFQPNAKIVAFEPMRRAADIYRKVFEDDANVTLHQFAIGPSRGTTEMQLSCRDDSSSLLPISDLLPQTFPGTQAVGTEQVNVAPLVDFLSPETIGKSTLLKLDVQGYEREALISAEPLLDRFCFIYAEASFVPFYQGQAMASDLIFYLHEQGWRLVGFMNPCFDPRTGRAMQADFLFANS